MTKNGMRETLSKGKSENASNVTTRRVKKSMNEKASQIAAICCRLEVHAAMLNNEDGASLARGLPLSKLIFSSSLVAGKRFSHWTETLLGPPEIVHEYTDMDMDPI